MPCCFCVDACPETLIQLHVFAHTSEKGFGAVCYAQLVFPDGRVQVSFVMARNRVAPLKQLSIPRLELQAAVLALRLNCLIRQELTVNTEDTIFWSDSETVLQYITNESQGFHTFIANRVYDTSNLAQWRHIPGRLNPADDCTRGLRVAKLNHHCQWLARPHFLSQPKDHWPQDMFIGPLRENVQANKWSGHAFTNGTRDYFPDPEKFSSWTRFRWGFAASSEIARRKQRTAFCHL